MTNILRFKIVSTEKVSEDRRIHVFDMLNQRNLSFNFDSMKRSPERLDSEEELSEFLDTKKFKIEHGYYDKSKGHVS
ncbi:hypothetical protein [Halobacillus sp. A5]|uniref:hypothetical protein n=1 Tax=Halobacillus sp. A5 TaxID=2880263 RepID=UPI0020A66BEF|nr:hypothetical protein [Halobacillus sp. A5]MCP3028171.1 hypothetical protein [Halobacillus sp. A5]